MIEYIEIFRMEIEYKGNQYKRIDKSVEEIAKIEIDFEDDEYEFYIEDEDQICIPIVRLMP